MTGDPERIGDGDQLERVRRQLEKNSLARETEDPERAAAREARRVALRAEHRLHRFEQSCPRRFLSARLSDLPASGAGAEARAWAEDPGSRNCLHVGEVGRGKTHAMVAQARRCAELFGWSPWILPVVELLDLLRPGNDAAAFERACSVHLLAVDDLGAERATDWTADRLAAVIDRRWLDELPTLATSNLTPGPDGELIEALGERSYSRLVGSGAVVIRWTGNDRRRKP